MARTRSRAPWPAVALCLLALAALTVGALALDSGPRASTAQPATTHGEPAQATNDAAAPGAQDALNLLRDGNDRFVRGRPVHPNGSAARLAEVARGQKPFATIVGCADSRVPPEILFDRGIGDLFVIRTAGHVVDEAALGTIEYGVEHLHTPLIVVLGHSGCGAVQATVATVEKGGAAPGAIGRLIEEIRPVVEETRGLPGAWLDNAVEANVRHTVLALKHAKPILEEAIEAGHVRIVGAIYDLTTGEVRFLP